MYRIWTEFKIMAVKIGIEYFSASEMNFKMPLLFTYFFRKHLLSTYYGHVIDTGYKAVNEADVFPALRV